MDNDKPMLVLGIETTCDETAAAVVERQRDGSGKILSNIVRSQTDEHARFGGVVPEIAARAHVDLLDGIVGQAMKDANVGFAQLSAVAAAAGPGLIGGVIVGLTTAKAIAMVHDTPLIAVNHLEGHALSPRLVDKALDFPYLLLLVSGGHCQLLRVEGAGRPDRIAEAFLHSFKSTFGPVRDRAVQSLRELGPEFLRAFLEHDEGSWDRDLAMTLGSTVHVTRAVLPGMLDRGWGRIVMVSSVTGTYGGGAGVAGRVDERRRAAVGGSSTVLIRPSYVDATQSASTAAPSECIVLLTPEPPALDWCWARLALQGTGPASLITHC